MSINFIICNHCYDLMEAVWYEGNNALKNIKDMNIPQNSKILNYNITFVYFVKLTIFAKTVDVNDIMSNTDLLGIQYPSSSRTV